jgi:hypothetical protein
MEGLLMGNKKPADPGGRAGASEPGCAQSRVSRVATLGSVYNTKRRPGGRRVRSVILLTDFLSLTMPTRPSRKVYSNSNALTRNTAICARVTEPLGQ